MIQGIHTLSALELNVAVFKIGLPGLVASETCQTEAEADAAATAGQLYALGAQLEAEPAGTSEIHAEHSAWRLQLHDDLQGE